MVFMMVCGVSHEGGGRKISLRPSGGLPKNVPEKIRNHHNPHLLVLL